MIDERDAVTERCNRPPLRVRALVAVLGLLHALLLLLLLLVLLLLRLRDHVRVEIYRRRRVALFAAARRGERRLCGFDLVHDVIDLRHRGVVVADEIDVLPHQRLERGGERLARRHRVVDRRRERLPEQLDAALQLELGRGALLPRRGCGRGSGSSGIVARGSVRCSGGACRRGVVRCAPRCMSHSAIRRSGVAARLRTCGRRPYRWRRLRRGVARRTRRASAESAAAAAASRR